ncbi:MAG: alpha/beta hydrolase [Micrococcales bacterium]|nr:alpha/beta hydrolase [Micrococcales bacterium]
MPDRRLPLPRWEIPGASLPRALRFFAADYPNAMRLRLRPHGAHPPSWWAHGDRAPVVLLPGVFEPWHYLGPIGDRLNREGHPVIALPELGRNQLRVTESAAVVRRVLQERDLRRIVLVAHSKGGLIGKLLLSQDADERIQRLVAVATPFRGSTMASWMLSRPLRDFRISDATIVALADASTVEARITSIYPLFDPHIPEGSRLPGARNVPLRMAGHFAPILSPLAIDVIAREVDRADQVDRRDAAPEG